MTNSNWTGPTHDNNGLPIISNLPSAHVRSGSRYVQSTVDVDCAFDDDDDTLTEVERPASKVVESRFASSLQRTRKGQSVEVKGSRIFFTNPCVNAFPL
jgi:hypothetical protein